MKKESNIYLSRKELTMRLKRVAIVLSLLCLFLLLVHKVNAQDFLVCSNCGQKNDITSKFCTTCGDSLDDEYRAFLLQRNAEVLHDIKFTTQRVDPPRLFTIPTAYVLGSKDISLMGGGAFGVAMQRSFLGTIGIGLGNVAEVEFSTVGLINNISNGSPNVSTSAFKLQIIPEDFLGIGFFPIVALSIRSSADWKDVQSDWSTLNADKSFYDYNSFTGRKECAINSIGYNTRFTIMHGVTTLPLGPINLHAGLSLTDVRVKETVVDYIWEDDNEDLAEKQVNLIGGFAGFDIESNPQTKIMFEAKSVANYMYNMDTKEIEVTHTYTAIGGVRFFFTQWLSIDTGVLYQTNYSGLADSQIKLGLNLFLPTGNLKRITLPSIKDNIIGEKE